MAQARELISRHDAFRLGLKRYFTGDACTHGHTVSRYTSNSACVSCAMLSAQNEIPTPRNFKWKQPRTVNWNRLTEEQIELWYHRINMIIQRKTKQYRHHPLDETNLFVPQGTKSKTET